MMLSYHIPVAVVVGYMQYKQTDLNIISTCMATPTTPDYKFHQITLRRYLR